MVTEIKTEHPHIVRDPERCGGRPIIKGTKLAVDLIAGFLTAGTTPQEILEWYPQPYLTPGALHDAISYYYDHKAEIDAIISGSTPEKLAEQYGYEIGAAGLVNFKDR
jgi:uncharacterized protein (DUF433 family)